jgi:hypothetical protein
VGVRLRLIAVLVALVSLPALALAAAPAFKATLKAPKANPKINVKWHYSIKVTDLAGKPIAATVTANMLDPFGGVHPVNYGPTQKPIVNFRFRGTFRDYLEFPPESKGFTLTARWTVKAKGGRRIVTRKVVPAQ